MEGKPVLINSLDGPYLDWTYVEDIAEGMERAWATPNLPEDVYSVTCGMLYSIGDVLEQFQKHLPNFEYRVVPEAEANYLVSGEAPGPVPSNARMQRDFGWVPSTSFDDGMKRYLDLDPGERTAMTSTPKRAPALGDLTPVELKAGGFDTAVLPVGATEYHGAHLPFSTDTIAADTLAHRLAWEIGTAVVLPAVGYGMSLHMLNWPWSLSLRPETLTNVIIDIAESLLKNDITRLLVVTAHDGNPPCAENAARELNDRHGIAVAVFGGWQGMSKRLLEGQWEIDEDHGGQSEMSMTLYAAPQLARPGPRGRSAGPERFRTGQRSWAVQQRRPVWVQRRALEGFGR